MSVVATLLLLLEERYSVAEKSVAGSRKIAVKRERCNLMSVFAELGGHFDRAHRMNVESFWHLHDKLKPGLKADEADSKKRKRSAPNGTIDSSLCLSAALQYFAGGDPLDIMIVHGISHSESFLATTRLLF